MCVPPGASAHWEATFGPEPLHDPLFVRLLFLEVLKFGTDGIHTSQKAHLPLDLPSPFAWPHSAEAPRRLADTVHWPLSEDQREPTSCE